MNIKHTLIAILGLAMSLTARAETVTLSTPGTLADALKNPGVVTSLTINGVVNAADFDYINSELTALTELNLSGASIAGYSGDPVLYGRTTFAANELPANALGGTRVTSVTLPQGITAIGDGAFNGSSISAISIPASVTAIGEGVFAGCRSLKSITIPASVKNVGKMAMAHCPALTSATYEPAVLPEGAFAGCSALATVDAPALTAIGPSAFQQCTALTNFTFPATLAVVGEGAFEWTSLTEARLDAATSLAAIGDRAFAHCTSLTSATLPAAMTSLGDGVFLDCPALTSAALPKGVTEIPAYAFKGDAALNVNTTFHNGITAINDFALKGVEGQATVTLPASLVYIGDEGMADMTGMSTLQAFRITSGVPELGENVWLGVDQPNVKLEVPVDLDHAYSSAPQWQNFNITLTSSQLITADDASCVNARFAGTDLLIDADTQIVSLQVFDLGGRMIISAAPASANAVVDTSRFTDKVYVVNITLDDDTPATFKLAR